jgi:phage tail sheath protein FI
MPVTLTAPGVYIEEIPSGVRTITGVATSVTAFIGRAQRGPVNVPTLISSFGDFQRTFGGLWLDAPMSYAVRDFFLSGGGQAVIVRLYVNPTSPVGDGRARFETSGSPPGDLPFLAAEPGAFGNRLQMRIDAVGNAEDPSNELRNRYGSPLYNLTVWEGEETSPSRREFIRNVSTAANSPRRVDRVLEIESRLIRLDTAELAFPPGGNLSVSNLGGAAYVASGGSDGLGLTTNAHFLGDNTLPRNGMQALDNTDLFNILCIPPDTRGGDVPADVYTGALSYCVRRRAMLIVDPPSAWGRPDQVPNAGIGAAVGVSGLEARNAAIYYPRVKQADPQREGQVDTFVACGLVAGRMADTDTRRGVWKAPAGVDVSVPGIVELATPLNDSENGTLNNLGVNCFRTFPVYGPVIWGARTMRGADQMADEYKYIPVRRLALYIEESLFRGTQWVVFEPNDEPLWAQIRMNVGAFMHTLFRKGAFQGSKPSDAYLVKCDRETTTQDDINRGVVNVLVAFAPLKPAEFVVIQIQQLAGQIAT